MWNNIRFGSQPFRVPKRENEDPMDFFRQQKRKQTNQSATAQNSSQQLQNPAISQLQNIGGSLGARSTNQRIDEWLEEDGFGGGDVDCPPDMPVDSTTPLIAPTPGVGEDAVEGVVDQDTMATERRIVKEVEEAMQNDDLENDEEAEVEAEDVNNPLIDRLQSEHALRNAEDAIDVGFDGFDEPAEGTDSETVTPRPPPSNQPTGIPPPQAEPIQAGDHRDSIPAAPGGDVQSQPVNDPTTPVYYETSDFNLSPFELSLALWVKKHNISRQAYADLRDVLLIPRHRSEFEALPLRKETVINRLHRVIPLNTLRKGMVKLDPDVLPSRTKFEEPVYVFDIESMIKILLGSSKLFDKMYRGMAQVTDGSVTEPWQARWWGESLRTTSGRFFFYPSKSLSVTIGTSSSETLTEGSSETAGTEKPMPIFPSDFVRYKCPFTGENQTPACPCNSDELQDLHIGRVRYCGLDARHGHPQAPVILLQPVFPRSPTTLPTEMMPASIQMIDAIPHELVLVEGYDVSVFPSNIVGMMHEVDIDYSFTPERPREPTSSSHSTVRYLFNWKTKSYRPVRLSSPHRGELELKQWGRQHFEDNFVGEDRLSLPWSMFIDAFGLYASSYVSIMGVYITALFFEEWLRTRREGIFPVTLGPHGANLGDVIRSLAHLTRLDKGIWININNERLFVCSFVAYFVGDMLSQQKLAGCKSHQANQPCRFCFITNQTRSDLDFDVIRHGRFHYQHLDNIAFIEQLPTKSAQTKAQMEFGIHDDTHLIHILKDVFPALDYIRTRVHDAAHSEFAGLARILTDYLFEDEGFLHERFRKEAAFVFQEIRFPPGWARIQNPKTHRKSFRMKEYARLVVIAPMLLLGWLKREHIKPEFQQLLIDEGPRFLDTSDLNYQILRPDAYTCREWMTLAYWRFAQSVLTIFTRNGVPTTEEFNRAVIGGRKAFQYMCHVLGNGKKSSSKKPSQATSSRGTTTARGRTSRRGRGGTGMGSTPTFTPIATVAENSAVSAAAPSSVGTRATRRTPITPGQKGNEILNRQGLPNVHAGIHLSEVLEEYGSCRLALTFQGEDEHKEFTRDIFATNHQNAASTLIQRANERRSISFILAGCFEHSHPDVHYAFSVLKESCPGLAASYDPYLGGEGFHLKEEVSTLEIRSDPHHHNPLALHGLSENWVKSREDSLLSVVDPRLEDEYSDFMVKLREAFKSDYNRPYIFWGTKKFLWAEKVSFAFQRRSTRRVFKTGDFIRILNEDRKDTSTSFAYLDGIFTYHQTGQTYMFAVVTVVKPRVEFPTHEFILECPIYEFTPTRRIIGLPSILPDQVWMITRGDGDFVYVNHDIYFM